MPNVWFGYVRGLTDLPRKVHCLIDYHVENFFPKKQKAKRYNNECLCLHCVVPKHEVIQLLDTA